jgi:hypothetical protein
MLNEARSGDPGLARDPAAAPRGRLDGARLAFDLALLALVGLAAQGLWSALQPDPSYMDAFYYATNGQRLAAGHGFSEMVIWQYLDEPAGLPAPSHTYWMPLPSLLAAAGYRLGQGYSGARLPFWSLAGLIPLLAYAISWLISGERWQGWVAGLLTASGGFYAPFLGQTATFAPFAWFAAGSLLSLGLARRAASMAAQWTWLAAGLLAGLAYLTRADGLLLVLVAGVLWLLGPGRRPARPGTLALFLAGFLLVAGAWLARTWMVTGRLLPGAGAQTLFLTSYDDLYSFGREHTLATYLSWGWANILSSKAQATWHAVQTLVAAEGLIFLTPFILLALWAALRREAARSLLLAPLLFGLALLPTMTLLFSFPGIRGSFFHSSIALWPFAMALAPAGIDLAVRWAAARLPHWRPGRAARTFSALFVGMAFMVSFAADRTRSPSGEVAQGYLPLARLVEPGAAVMVGNAPAFHYATGLPALSIPNEPLDVVLQVADRYGADYLLLNEHTPEPLRELYERPASNASAQLIGSEGTMRLFRLGAPSR